MKTILDVIRKEKRQINASCNGKKSCGQCRIRVLENDYPVVEKEKKLLTENELNQGIRLACCHEYRDNLHYELMTSSMAILDEIDKKSDYSFQEDGNGLIIDIGTTTVVMKWISLNTGECIKTVSFMNPQCICGSDVISRIQYNETHPHYLHQLLIEKIESYINDEIDIKRMIVCGNTVMTHLFLDADISSLGHVPFDIPIKDMKIINSQLIFHHISKTFMIYTFPHIGPFVGGDLTSGILSLDIDKSSKIKMLIDLGTNGEIVIGNKDGILTTSTAAGPAFEGVGISCGGSSIEGAITNVKIEKNHVSYQTIGHAKAECLCGSGLISLIAQMKRHHIIDELGRLYKGDRYDICENIYITQKDIQAFQLAKAAIQAGITALLNEKGDVDEIYISGGFGSHIDVLDLIELNMISPLYLNKVKNIKNSALSGAYETLMTCDYHRLDHIVNISKYMNLAENPDFQDLLVDGLYF